MFRYSRLKLALGLSVTTLISASIQASPLEQLKIECQPNAAAIPASNLPVKNLTQIGRSVSNAEFNSSAAEIVSYDSCTDRLYVVNAQASRVDIMRLNPKASPTFAGHIDLNTAALAAGIKIGAANSIATHNGLIAVAIENADKQQNGIIGLYRSDTLELITTYPAGALPDMVGISADGRYIASANEGEPSKDYAVDPEGSITLVDISTSLTGAKVYQIDFRDFNQGSSRHSEIKDKVRISAPGASVAQDLEPEYLTFADNDKLYAALQENNALAAIDLHSKKVEAIFGLGGKSWSNAKIDASDKDKLTGNLQNYPQLQGLYMPDTIASFTRNGQTYILTANEGDGREYGIQTTQKLCDLRAMSWDGPDYTNTAKYSTEQGFCIAHSDETRGMKLAVDPAHPLAAALQDPAQLGRLKVINDKAIGAHDPVYAYGARSFSIWDQNGTLVFDSGDEFARIVHKHAGKNTNSSNDSNNSGDTRSDDKGAEPEAIETATINGRQYAFIGLERQGGIMIYDVTIPAQSQFVTYVNKRDFTANVCTAVDNGECSNGIYHKDAGDLGPESIKYFHRGGHHYLAVGNEVSGSTSVYKIAL